MAALPYMPLYVADYLADTAHLTALEHGAYLLLIMNYWQRGKPLPSDDDRLARIARVSQEEWRSIRPVMAEFFAHADGCWVHDRIDTELNKVRDKSTKAKAAGKLSAAARIVVRPEPDPEEIERLSNERSTDVQRTFNHTDTDTDTEKKEPTSDEVGPAEPVETPQQRLWSEGLAALLSMGVAEKKARPVMGLWLRDSGDDAARVLGAIQRAREHAPMDPIPWINAGFAKIKSRRETVHDRQTAIAEAFGPTLYSLAEQRFAGADEPDSGLRLALPSPG